MKNSAGFALVAVLWLISTVSALVGVGLASIRIDLRASGNRIILTRGRWAAEACLAIVQARWREHRLDDTTTIDLGDRTQCMWRVDDPSADIRRSTDDTIGTVNLNAAPESVLSRLPGMSPESVERILSRRMMDRPLNSLDELAGLLSPNARAALMGAYPELARIVAFAPSRLVITAVGWVGNENPHAVIELLTVPLKDRLATIRRRMS